MSNVVLALNLLANVAQAALAANAARPREMAVAGSQGRNKEVLAACWQQLAALNTLPGVDPLTSARCNALNLANTALFSAGVATTQKQVEALEATAAAYHNIHDRIAGASWYSTGSTVRGLRAESRQIQSDAEMRALLTKLVEAITELAATRR